MREPASSLEPVDGGGGNRTANHTVYLNTLENGDWRIIGLDWDTGEHGAGQRSCLSNKQVVTDPNRVRTALGAGRPLSGAHGQSDARLRV